jgi:hypothetical protein
VGRVERARELPEHEQRFLAPERTALEPRSERLPPLPVAIERAYELLVWLDGRVHDFPAAARSMVGRRIVDAAVDLLDELLGATYAPGGSEAARSALERANGRLALLRLLVRLARDRRYLSTAQHEHAAERLVEVGRMVGGWLRAGRK